MIAIVAHPMIEMSRRKRAKTRTAPRTPRHHDHGSRATRGACGRGCAARIVQQLAGMGTDIHLFVEVRDGADQPWHLERVESLCTWCDGSKSRGGGECYGCKGRGQKAGYDDRNYSTFAILASVRNGHGFAGIRTGDGFNPIATPRGLPSDMSPELRIVASADALHADLDAVEEKYGESWLRDHSHSWLTLRDLLDYDWGQVTRHRGVVALAEYRRWRKTTEPRPREWYGDVKGPGVVIMREGDTRVVEADLSDRLYVEAFWTMTYADSAGAFYSRFTPALVTLCRDPNDVRIVFGFDS